MLYVFHVIAGHMLHFDMQAAVLSVGELKVLIQQSHHIPSEKQVLLVSGGKGLKDDNKVCSYLGGTDSNPLFLFFKVRPEDLLFFIEKNVLRTEDTDILTQANNSIGDSSVSATMVQSRAHIAEDLYLKAQGCRKECTEIVKAQHLQQQGWMAVVANFDDIVTEFKQNAESFEQTYQNYFTKHDHFLQLVHGFKDDIALLAKIPLLPSLIRAESDEGEMEETEEEEMEKDEEQIKEETEGDSEENTDRSRPSKPRSLLDYINKSGDNSLDVLFNACSAGLGESTSSVHQQITNKISLGYTYASKEGFRVIKGFGNRLFALNQLLDDCEKYVKDQHDQSVSVNSNNSRLLRTTDRSMLADLCSSHQLQLKSMIENHQKLCDIRYRCIKAKEELQTSLLSRVELMMYAQSAFFEINNLMFVSIENIKRLCRNMEVLEQFHTAPELYVKSIAEVVRRRKFSQSFLLWGSDIACRMFTIYNDEVARRKEFAASAEGHFLSTTLFPGFDDIPPPFAIEAPPTFDTNLPTITEEDIQALKEQIPELLHENLKVDDISTSLEFFAMKEVKNEIEEDNQVAKEILIDVSENNATAPGDILRPTEGETSLGAPILPFLKDFDRGCESETDTEEFEKLCQSPLELQFDREVSATAKTQDVGTATEDNLHTSRTESDKLRGSLIQASSLTLQVCANFKTEMRQLYDYFDLEKNEIVKHHQDLTDSWVQVSNDNEAKAKHISRLIAEHDELLTNFNTEIETKNEQLQLLRNENFTLEQHLKQYHIENMHLKKELDKVNSEAKEEIDRLRVTIAENEEKAKEALESARQEATNLFKLELQKISARFAPMTTMEQVPIEVAWVRTEMEPGLTEFEHVPVDMEQLLSEMNYIKLQQVPMEMEEAPTNIETPTETVPSEEHQIPMEMEDKKSEEISETVQSEIALEELLEEATKNQKFLKEEYEVVTAANAHKDTYINQLQMEVDQLKTLLKKESKAKQSLAKQLSDMVADAEKIDEVNSSVIGLADAEIDSATSSVPHDEALIPDTIKGGLTETHTFTTSSCDKDDIVLVLWDPKQENYRIRQNGNTTYFLHSDCLTSVGLKTSEGIKRNCRFIGQVIHKDFCAARKAQNRYNVPINSKFYRVMVKRLSNFVHDGQDCDSNLFRSVAERERQCSTSADEDSAADVSRAGISTPVTPTRSSSVMECSFTTPSIPETAEGVMETSASSSNRSLKRFLQPAFDSQQTNDLADDIAISYLFIGLLIYFCFLFLLHLIKYYFY